jgi:hypothetical protein
MEENEKLRITGDEIESGSSNEEFRPPPPPTGGKAKTYGKSNKTGDGKDTLKVTWDDLEKASARAKGNLSAGGTKVGKYGKAGGTPTAASASSPNLARKSWFYLSLAGFLGALLGWSLTEPTYGGGHDSGGKSGVLDEFSRRLSDAGAQSGEITLSLMWSDFNDLDLHCLDPSGETIFFGNKFGRYGTLDVDRNVEPTTSKPVENIFFEKPLPGQYRVYLNHYATHSGPSSQEYQVRVTVSGQREEFFGIVAYGASPTLVHTFDYSGSPRSELDEIESSGFGDWAMIPLVLAFACVGFGVAESVVERSPKKALYKGIIALPLGLVLGFVAYQVAEGIYASVGYLIADASSSSPLTWVLRGFSWVIFGIAAGLVYGIAGKSGQKCLYGCIGGALGAFLGGFLFNPVVGLTGGAEVSRAVGFVVLGCSTGLSMGLVESALKDRWLFVVSGPLAGKQFILYKERTIIGSNSSSDIYLFKDTAVSQTHAVLELTGASMILKAKGATKVGGVVVREKVLSSGDFMEIGQYSFRYEEKNKETGASAGLKSIGKGF